MIAKVLQGVTGEARLWLERHRSDLWISRFDNFLQRLPEDQVQLLSNKFNNVVDSEKLNDYLVEIWAAVEYQNGQPEFLEEKDKERTPDIFLKKSLQYIEVKRYRYSDNYKKILEKLAITKSHTDQRDGTKDQLIKEEKEAYEVVLKQAKDKVDNALLQLKGKFGFIYFVYSIDLDLFAFRSVKDKSKDLECDLRLYAKGKEASIVCKDFFKLFE
jgi:hypothetical protein